MYWKNDKTFLSGLLISIKNSKIHRIRYFYLPTGMFLFLCLLVMIKFRKFESVLSIFQNNQVLFYPFYLLVFIIYIFKPLNDYFSLKQEFIIDNESILVKNYRNFFWIKSDVKIKKEDIKFVTYEKYSGAFLFVSTFISVAIPYITDDEFNFLLKEINSSGKIPINIIPEKFKNK